MHAEQRTVAIPVFNTSDSAVNLRKGECLRSLTELNAEKVIDVISVDLEENIASASSTHLSDKSVDAENSAEDKFQEIVNKERMKNIPETYPVKAPVENSIDLKDKVPVYEHPFREREAATYFDRKLIDSELQIGDRVRVYLPRLESAKLQPKWIGPFEVKICAHPCYKVATEEHNKWLPRDRLRKVKKECGELNLYHDLHVDLPDNGGNEKQDLVVSDDDEDDAGAANEHDIEERPRYFFRNRQERPYYGY
eukprot:Seg905.5 transcript_id=Seg905.5/GoldUCD/mRNA.D3Y31 product="hypothetical protein" protein_id=Seg905.5/GoldUCD/D3Y31